MEGPRGTKPDGLDANNDYVSDKMQRFEIFLSSRKIFFKMATAGILLIVCYLLFAVHFRGHYTQDAADEDNGSVDKMDIRDNDELVPIESLQEEPNYVIEQNIEKLEEDTEKPDPKYELKYIDRRDNDYTGVSSSDKEHVSVRVKEIIDNDQRENSRYSDMVNIRLENKEANPNRENYLNETRRLKIDRKLREMGLESTELHDFKSIYVREPRIYDNELTPKAPGIRKTKIISCYNCPGWYIGGGTPAFNRDFRNCPYSECYFDRHGSLQMDAAVVLFFPKPKSMPPRPYGQIWAHVCWEPPSYYSFMGDAPGYDEWKGVFNWTFGYAQDHDFFQPNNLLGWRSQETMLSDDEYMKFAQRKTKTAVWWVSNCGAVSRRDEYVEEMQKYIDVDIYGKCGPLKCENWGTCSRMFNDTYKFYLAFENSFCKDYVTPKYFRNFLSRTLIIPVARSGFEYEKYFPPNTFINTNDFKSAKSLALYLKNLANDVPRYAEFLKQKDRIRSLEFKNDWCDFCEMLHTRLKVKTIPDVMKQTHKDEFCWDYNDID